VGARRRLGHARWLHRVLRRTFGFWERLGVHVTPNHYSQPVPDVRALPERLWTAPSELVGVELGEAGQLARLAGWAAAYGAEYGAFPERAPGAPATYFLRNSMLIGTDAAVLHCMLRDLRPRRVIEVGGGFSTLVAAAALRRNREEGAGDAELVTIDPWPGPTLRAAGGLTRLVERPVQEVPLAEFTGLGPGDVLFIDSSHVVRIGSDVQHEILEILPRLRPGVAVHVHDVFLPDEYPRHWITRNRWFWTEQYLLHAFLCFNSAYEVLWAGAFLARRHPARLAAAFPWTRWDGRRPGSFWIRRAR
jgi:hypothetical protein